MVLTIGHSNHGYASFLELLRGAGAEAVVDVRSVAYSRRVPHFNGKRLPLALPQRWPANSSSPRPAAAASRRQVP